MNSQVCRTSACPTHTWRSTAVNTIQSIQNTSQHERHWHANLSTLTDNSPMLIPNPCSFDFHLKLVLTLKKTQFFSIANNSKLVKLREMTSMCSEIHTKHIKPSVTKRTGCCCCFYSTWYICLPLSFKGLLATMLGLLRHWADSYFYFK